jgi:pyruvate kinase
MDDRADAPPAELLDRLSALRRAVRDEGRRTFARWRGGLERPAFRASALNLAHYLALRRRDLRETQSALAMLGLSSLGRAEGRVLANLDAVISALAALAGRDPPDGVRRPAPRAFLRGVRRLDRNAAELFGESASARRTRILATLGADAADDPAVVLGHVRAGAEAVRINCAHDDREAWLAMTRNVRAAEARTGRRVRVLMDLGGPKVRTGAVRTPGETGRLRPGDGLLLTRGGFVPDGPDFQAECAIPEIVDRLAPGARVHVDDGRYSGAVERVDDRGALVRIARTGPEGAKLKAEKGLNFPDTDLGLSPLTAKDLRDLDTAAAEADLIGYSFVERAADVALLQRELAARRPEDWRRLGLVAKIETARAVANLPDIIVEAAARQPFACMIARGDLAVALGFERLAEMQEELLWVCEAAHVPVIWATQVLESLIKRGLPSRGEMTDAAMAARAECVMLNKGPNVDAAVEALDRLLVRMDEHQSKKTPRLRALRSWVG